MIGECKNNYRCVVDKKNRTSCKACRLRKCLMVGMSKSGSRYGRRSNWFKIHCLMQQSPSSGSDPPSQVAGHTPWPSRKDDSSSDARDSSFGSSSRSPSPLNSSLETKEKRDSVSPPRQSVEMSPPSSMYSPLFPFYSLSPLLTHPLLLSLASQSLTTPRPHLDLLAEHRQLLAKFGAARSALASAGQETPTTRGGTQSGDSPMDLSIKLTASTCLPSASNILPVPPSPVSSAPDDEGIEVDIVDKSTEMSDNNSNLLTSANFEERRDALDLTVSS